MDLEHWPLPLLPSSAGCDSQKGDPINNKSKSAKNIFYFEQVFGNDFPSVYELDSLPSLILINQHFTLNYPRPMQPNILEVGGMHVSREIKPLAKDFKDFIDGAKEGVVYFSMGSNLRSDQMAPEKTKAFLEAFSEIPQRVVWKWEADSLPGKSANLKVAPWMPQQEILGTKLDIALKIL
jgi:UDP:flavonoid glycosyltransferase YjiC (YdhE family)